jgi:hypothetical protein
MIRANLTADDRGSRPGLDPLGSLAPDNVEGGSTACGYGFDEIPGWIIERKAQGDIALVVAMLAKGEGDRHGLARRQAAQPCGPALKR